MSGEGVIPFDPLSVKGERFDLIPDVLGELGYLPRTGNLPIELPYDAEPPPTLRYIPQLAGLAGFIRGEWASSIRSGAVMRRWGANASVDGAGLSTAAGTVATVTISVSTVQNATKA